MKVKAFNRDALEEVTQAWLAAFLMSPVSRAASDNKWPSKQQAEQQLGYTSASTMRKKTTNKSVPLTQTASFCTLNNLTPHSVKGELLLYAVYLQLYRFFFSQWKHKTLQWRKKSIIQIVLLRERERLIYQLCTAQSSARYFLPLKKKVLSVGRPVFLNVTL